MQTKEIDSQLKRIINKNKLIVQSRPITLYLKRSFNTAHSQSTTRTNFIFKISSLKGCSSTNEINENKQQISNILLSGYGECGLPPKKPYCYISDINDCIQFAEVVKRKFQLFNEKLKKQIYPYQYLKKQLINSFDYVFQNIIKIGDQQNEEYYFQFFKSKLSELINQNYNVEGLYFYSQVFQLFNICKCLSQQKKQYLAPRNSLQFALLDLVGKVQSISVAQIIYPQRQSNKQTNDIKQQTYSFYTLSHQQNLHSMLQNGKQSLICTPYIKIKFNNHIDKLIQLLILLDHNQVGLKWIIDANACWSPQNYKQFQIKINQVSKNNKRIIQKILYIQQPFPVFQSLKNTKQSHLNQKTQFLTEKLIQQWQQIKLNTKFIIIADQSFTSFESFNKVKSISHGINIKMEKCGGPIQACKILKQIKRQDIKNFMFGSMVSTNLGCSQTFQFYQFARYFDIDGALLVKSPQIKGGFQWKGQNGIFKLKGYGLSLNQKDLEDLFDD